MLLLATSKLANRIYPSRSTRVFFPHCFRKGKGKGKGKEIVGIPRLAEQIMLRFVKVSTHV